MNGYGVLNYENVPKGWDHFDGLVSDYSSGGDGAKKLTS